MAIHLGDREPQEGRRDAMRQLVLLAAAGLAAATLFGCQEGAIGTSSGATALTAACPGCGMQATEGTYCAKCNAIATTETGMVRCPGCGKDFKAGTYCAQCNSFVTGKTCTVDGRQVPLGGYDARLEIYAGTQGVSCCKNCKRPCAAGKPCPRCGS
jgi:hypothetical protein